MPGKRTIALFACAFLLALFITAPASLLDSYVRHATHDRMVLANASGTVWQGTATPAVLQPQGGLVTLSTLHWKLAVLPLFSGKLRIHVQWDELPPASATEVTISYQQIELQHLFIPLPAKLLSEASTILKPLEFRGQMQVQAEHLVWSKRGMEGAAAVDWQEASSALSSIVPLGNYHLALNGAGERVNIGLSTTSGTLLLQGQGGWSAARGLEFHGQAQASPGNAERLTELLHHLGPEVSPGVHAFNLLPQ